MFSKIRKIVFSTSVLFFSAINSDILQASDISGNTPSNTGFTNPLESKTITEFLLKIIDILLVFALPITVLFIMYGGFMLVTAQGESGKLEKGRNAILWAVIGGVIALGAKVIIDVIQKTVNTL